MGGLAWHAVGPQWRIASRWRPDWWIAGPGLLGGVVVLISVGGNPCDSCLEWLSAASRQHGRRLAWRVPGGPDGRSAHWRPDGVVGGSDWWRIKVAFLGVPCCGGPCPYVVPTPWRRPFDTAVLAEFDSNVGIVFDCTVLLVITPEEACSVVDLPFE